MSSNFAYVNGQLVTELEEVTDDLSIVGESGKWIVVGFFEGPILAFKFNSWVSADVPKGTWNGVRNWKSDTNQTKYVELVKAAQHQISEGNFYQVNVCHQYETDWDSKNSIEGLFRILVKNYSAQFSALIHIEDKRLLNYGLSEIKIASVSPELFLRRKGGELQSSPIKGTVAKGENFLEKDEAENIMIVDLVRNDLARVCETASIHVPELLKRVELPNLDHLVSTVSGRLLPNAGWDAIFDSTFPPGSVTGAPKSSALNFIKQSEVPREIYCGALGWIDSDSNEAEIAVAIRTFWKSGNLLKFGAGAGITWGSIAEHEWNETELKAKRLLDIASQNLEVDK